MPAIIFKHMGSSAFDAYTNYEIDRDQQIVRATQAIHSGKPFFSSGHLIGLAERLANEGVDLIVDDQKSWHRQQAPWRLLVRIGDQEYEARFYRLLLEKTVCVELWPAAPAKSG